MASHQSTVSSSIEPPNIDLMRRYCPTVTQHTHAELAACLFPDTNGCWVWTGNLTHDGYGYVACEPTAYGLPQSVRVHRYMYDLLVSDIPYGYHVHHRCRNKTCWNLFHLQAVTPKEHLDIHRNGHK